MILINYFIYLFYISKNIITAIIFFEIYIYLFYMWKKILIPISGASKSNSFRL